MLARIFGESFGWALLIARLVLGVIFIAHGGQKLFEMGVGQVAGFFEGVGIPLPAFFAWVVSLTELFGGIAVLIGLFTRYAAVGIAIVMVVAIFTVKLKVGLIGARGPGYELDLALLALALALVLAGPGKLSLEKILLKREI